MSTSTEVAVAAATLPDKINYARALADSGLLPAAFRKQPANVLYAVEYGAMLGLSPMAALTGIHVIDGKPTASAALMSALVRRQGHRLRVSFDKAAMAAYAELTRSDDPDFTYRAEWNLARAVTAELCTVKDGKPLARDKNGKALPWEKYPENMMKWRCISEVCRDAAEECLMGMHYTPEELGVDVDDEGIPVRVAAERVSESDKQPETQPTPDWDALIAEYETAGDLTKLGDLWHEAKRLRPNDADLKGSIEQAAKRIPTVVTDGQVVEPEPSQGITEKQSKRLHAMLTEHGINRETKLALLTSLTGREITTSSELTETEATDVTDWIAAKAKEPTPLIETAIELIDRPAGEPS